MGIVSTNVIQSNLAEIPANSKVKNKVLHLFLKFRIFIIYEPQQFILLEINKQPGKIFLHYNN